jgi:DinB superfamily
MGRGARSGHSAWVRCDGCGFEWGSIPGELVVPSLREFPQRYAVELARDDAALRRRPAADVWSALEYACHVRDVLLVMRERVLQVLREPSPPAFTPMGRDERVRDDRYAEQSPDDVARQITDAAGMLAFVFEGLDEAQWAKRCVYGYPAPAERTLSWVAQQTLHELDHHLGDLRNSLVSAP